MGKRGFGSGTSKRSLGKKKWPLALLLGAIAALVISRGRSVISAAPRKSKSAVQELKADVRTMFGNAEPETTPRVDQSQRLTTDTTATITVPATEMPIEETTAGAGDAEAAENEAEPAPSEESETPSSPAEPAHEADTTATAPATTIEAGVDETGTFRPAKVETDDFGVVVTDTEPAGLQATEGWVKGDGGNDCPDGFPIKGNANSRIFHRPGEPSYEQTIPEICFADEEAANRAGYRPRKS